MPPGGLVRARQRGDDAEVPPVLAYVPYADFVADMEVLVAAIAADESWQPDCIVGIGRGGLVPAVYLSHATGLPMLSCDWSSTIDDTAEAAIDRLAVRTTQGMRLLLVDDINDSGRTIAAIRAALRAAGGYDDRIRFATLIDNSVSVERVYYRARIIDRTVTKDWFVFPWEAMASRAALTGDAAAMPARG